MVLPLVRGEVEPQALLPTVRHPPLKHALLARPEMGKDLVVGRVAPSDQPDRLAEGDETDSERIGECTVQIEDHAVELHSCSSGSRDVLRQTPTPIMRIGSRQASGHPKAAATLSCL